MNSRELPQPDPLDRSLSIISDQQGLCPEVIESIKQADAKFSLQVQNSLPKVDNPRQALADARLSQSRIIRLASEGLLSVDEAAQAGNALFSVRVNAARQILQDSKPGDGRLGEEIQFIPAEEIMERSMIVNQAANKETKSLARNGLVGGSLVAVISSKYAGYDLTESANLIHVALLVLGGTGVSTVLDRFGVTCKENQERRALNKEIKRRRKEREVEPKRTLRDKLLRKNVSN